MKRMRFVFILLAMVVTGFSGITKEDYSTKSTKEVAYELTPEVRALVDTVLNIDKRTIMKINIIKVLNKY